MSIYLPVWAEAGCKVIDTWSERCLSGTARYTRIRVKYLDKKGKEQITTKQVIWD